MEAGRMRVILSADASAKPKCCMRDFLIDFELYGNGKEDFWSQVVMNYFFIYIRKGS